VNIQEYISSGILEHYVLGLVSEEERLEVARNVAQYPEIKAELEAIEAALNTYAQNEALPMRSGLQEEILNKIDDLQKNPIPPTPLEKMAPRSRFGTIGLGLLALALGIVALLIYQNLKTSQNTLLTTEQRLEQIEDNCNSRIEYLQYQLNILRDPSIQITKMRKGDLSNPDVSTAAIANVYNNPDEEKVYIDLLQLPTPPTGKQYQLWGIRIVNGELQPTSMGIIASDTAAGVFTEMKYLENVDVYAISLENLGEQETPDLTQIYVLGETKAS